MKIDVLDKGFIELIDCLGDDRTVVNAARVSFAKESAEFNDADAKLVKYLADHKHVSPFYHPQLMFRVKAPISVQRQWFKHKVGTAENSESTRYVEIQDEFYLPDKFRAQSKSNKQGSDGYLVDEPGNYLQAYCNELYTQACEEAFSAYWLMIRAGVAKEQAREVLPLCTYTTWVWTASLAAVAHFIELRDEAHAQFEIRSYAQAMRTLAEQKFPVSIAALCGVHQALER